MIEANTTISTSFTSSQLSTANFQEPQNDKVSAITLTQYLNINQCKMQKISSQQPCISALLLTSSPKRLSRFIFFAVYPCRSTKISSITEIWQPRAKVNVVGLLRCCCFFFVCGRKKKKVGRSGRPTRVGINVCFARCAFVFFFLFFFTSTILQYVYP